MNETNKASAPGLIQMEAIWAKHKSKKYDVAYRIKNTSTDKTLVVFSGMISCFAGAVEGTVDKNTMNSQKIRVRSTQFVFQKPTANYHIETDTTTQRVSREDSELNDTQGILLRPSESKTFQLHCILPDSLKDERHLRITDIQDLDSRQVLVKEILLNVSN